MNHFLEGYEAWAADIHIEDCPYSDDDPEVSEERREWRAGWKQAKEDNSQIGVGS